MALRSRVEDNNRPYFWYMIIIRGRLRIAVGD